MNNNKKIKTEKVEQKQCKGCAVYAAKTNLAGRASAQPPALRARRDGAFCISP